jgi:hypothetical protein
MSRANNLSKARSHIIFIVALLSAAAYILWVEQRRGVAAEAPRSANAWSAEIGSFGSAEAAGRAWDSVKRQGQPARRMQIALLDGPEGVRLQVSGLGDQESAEQVCSAAADSGVPCSVTPPAP